MTLDEFLDKEQEKGSIKSFENLPPNAIEGTTYWFWVREHYAGLIFVIRLVFNCADSVDYGYLKLVLLLLVLPIPFILTPFAALRFKKHIQKVHKDEGGTIGFSKKSIEYYTMMDTLAYGNKES